MRKDHSYGIIPIYKKVANVPDCYFLLVQHSLGHWSFPKGHKEKGESDIETARRELAEETGIIDCDVVEEVSFDEHYSWNDRGIIVDKTVTLFPGFSETFFRKIDDKEIINSDWLKYNDALERLTYKNSKLLLHSVKNWLDSEPGRQLYEKTEIPLKEKTAVTQKALFEDAGKILMLKDHNGRWELPGGKIEAGESEEAGLKRELFEETKIASFGMRNQIGEFPLRVSYKVVVYNFLVKVFKCTLSEAPQIKLSPEHTDYGWFDETEIKVLPMREGYRDILLRYLKQIAN